MREDSCGKIQCPSCLARANLAVPDAPLDAHAQQQRPITRQSFLRGLGALAFLPLLRSVPAFAKDEPEAKPDMAVQEIAPGVFVHQGQYAMQSPENMGDMANCAFVVGDEAVAVIDTSCSAICGEALRKSIADVTSKPIRYVINTHMHPDHVFGNVAFKQDAPTFVGHHNLKNALQVRTDAYLTANERMIGPAFQGSEVILPDLGVEKKTELDLGGRALILEPQATAHTNNDLIVTDTGTDTLFLGDLLFSVHIPTLDGSITGWLALLDDFEKRKAARVVPGHGPHAMQLPGALKPEQLYLQTVADDVRKLIKDNLPLGEATKIAGYRQEHAWKLFDDYNARNVSAAYAELEWE
ncbi:quinoprotein relay system zinc metallohydrolase 2 [Methyloligella sp. GL2]|uniref:quinoprotein relay system zinc metallohydrolase 2 n=2 Tax=unclassified Methyloligella TaxID=2625955 RepID=UPI00157CA77F|nr:quinoprotein relay system zinc metallohydrolase 2 [Methyloligella sp. GL2]QKP76980.1 quinoprotein relay system zinc metallohydrolase 2 [Methyloligella sp. GL2]